MFAPYIDICAWPTLDASSLCQQVSFLKDYTLAFVVADPNTQQPSWGGYYPITTSNNDALFYRSHLMNLKAMGGRSIVSFGGSSGQELALVHNYPTSLLNAYETVLIAYGFEYLDFDIEGSALAHKESINLRNQTLALLKAKYPGIKISYTLPVLPTGLTADGDYLLASCQRYGVEVDRINLMTMNYGDYFSRGKTMGSLAIQACHCVFSKLQSMGLTSVSIGVIPMLGHNDVEGETFDIQDAVQLIQFARNTPWISFVSFWSINRDIKSGSGLSLTDFSFSNIFKDFIK